MSFALVRRSERRLVLHYGRAPGSGLRPKTLMLGMIVALLAGTVWRPYVQAWKHGRLYPVRPPWVILR